MIPKLTKAQLALCVIVLAAVALGALSFEQILQLIGMAQEAGNGG